MSSDVLQCPLMSCDVRQFLFNFGLPLIEEKEEITRINACSQLYKKGGMEPPFQGTYATSGASHVGIYVGDNKMLHCGNPIQYADITSSYWSQHFYAFGRL